MGPLGHTVISGAVGGGVWLATGSAAAAGAAIGAGVLIDVDHLYDYYQRYIKRKQNKVYVLFHAWEYSLVGLLILTIAFYHPVLLGLLLGHLSHVATDHSVNRLSPFGYSIIYRLFKRFDGAYIAPHDHEKHSYGIFNKLLHYDRWLEYWLDRRIKRWLLARSKRRPRPEASLSHSDD